MVEKQKAKKHIFSLPVADEEPTLPVRISMGTELMKLNVAPALPDKAAFTAEYPLPFSGTDIEIEADETFFRYLNWLDVLSEKTAESASSQLFHFAPRQGWLNDPNGLFYLNGEWHLFFQCNPLSAFWGNMHWGHAVSSDLIHWREVGLTLYPDSAGTMFSGAAVIDIAGVAGFGRNAILLFYTNCNYDGRGTQNLAVSTDGGKSFRKYEHNPILPNFTGLCDRDPQVTFDPEADVWRMAIFLGDEEKREFLLLASHDLLHWEKTDCYVIPGGRECPGILRMHDDVSGDWKWVFIEANGFYRVGMISQEGRITFECESRRFLLGDAYAGQCFQQAPDGRTVLIAWLRMPGGACGTWAGCMTLPMELRFAGGELLVCPAEEVETSVPVARRSAGNVTVSVPGENIVIDAKIHRISRGEAEWTLPKELKNVTGRWFFDRFSLEYFDDSKRFMAAFYIPNAETVKIRMKDASIYLRGN